VTEHKKGKISRRLQNATVGDFMIFKPLFEAYKAQNGSKDLTQLLSVQAKKCVIHHL
jgi:hypothetical protein